MITSVLGAQKSNPESKLELFVKSTRNWTYVQNAIFGELYWAE